jgi:hypothetical protein
LSMGEEQRKKNERVFRIKIVVVVVLIIIGFWGVVGTGVWRRQRDNEYKGIGVARE